MSWIHAGEFVEVRDLLSETVALHDQLEVIHGPLINAVRPSALLASIRGVPSLNSLVSCYLGYVAVRTNDESTRDMITHCCLIVREDLSHGGQRRQEYNRTFHAQAAIDHSSRWNVLLPDLRPPLFSISGWKVGHAAPCVK